MSDLLAVCCIIWLVLGALTFALVFYPAIVAGARADQRDRDAARIRRRLDDFVMVMM